MLSDSTIEEFRTRLEEDWNTFVADWVKIAQTPAPTGHEEKRADVIADLFREYGADTVERDSAGNVITSTSEANSPRVALTAHLDTVFDYSVDHTVTLDDEIIGGPGVGDDALGLATLVSILRTLPKQDRGHCLLVATTGTEGEGNLRGSRSFLQSFSEQLDFAICLEGHRLGRIDHRSLGTQRLKIRAESEGGHVWRDETGENPIGTLAQLMQKIGDLPRDLLEKGIVNFGKIQGGSAYNTVPYDAELNLEIRASETETLEVLSKHVHDWVIETGNQSSVSLEIDHISRRPVAGIPREHWLVESVSAVQEKLSISTRLGAASSDSSVFLDEGIPTVTVGLGNGENKHRKNETIELNSVQNGRLQLLLAMVESSRRFHEENGNKDMV